MCDIPIHPIVGLAHEKEQRKKSKIETFMLDYLGLEKGCQNSGVTFTIK